MPKRNTILAKSVNAYSFESVISFIEDTLDQKNQC